MARTPSPSPALPALDEPPSDASERYAIAAAGNVLKLLVGFGQLGSLSLGQAAEAAQVSPSTAYRLLVTLEAQGFVRRVGKRGYRIGPAAIHLAHALGAQSDLLSASEDVARELHELTGGSVRLALLGDTEVSVILGLDGEEPIWAQSREEMTVEAHASAMGKAICAYLAPTRLAAILGEEPYLRMTPRTLTTWRALQPRLDEIRTTGYALDLEESREGLVCVAVPIFRDDGAIGAISIQGARPLVEEPQFRRVVDVLRQAADKITSRLSRIRLRE
jgi:IclR family acetate operon transcriptional repressor